MKNPFAKAFAWIKPKLTWNKAQELKRHPELPPIEEEEESNEPSIVRLKLATGEEVEVELTDTFKVGDLWYSILVDNAKLIRNQAKFDEHDDEAEDIEEQDVDDGASHSRLAPHRGF